MQGVKKFFNMQQVFFCFCFCFAMDFRNTAHVFRVQNLPTVDKVGQISCFTMGHSKLE